MWKKRKSLITFSNNCVVLKMSEKCSNFNNRTTHKGSVKIENQSMTITNQQECSGSCQTEMKYYINWTKRNIVGNIEDSGSCQIENKLFINRTKGDIVSCIREHRMTITDQQECSGSCQIDNKCCINWTKGNIVNQLP